MQGQKTQQLAVTASQSLQVVQTLLKVSFGCVAYLRDLLPDDNFTDGYLTASGSDSFSRLDVSKGGDQIPDKNPPPSGALKVKTIKKDFSTEGNKLLQYLEEGIFDALEKQYLRSFIFAVYLDDEDPDNIIEAYTFNFSYHAVPGFTFKVPVMTLGERLEKMSLDTRPTSNMDPATDAIMKGNAPTLGDVKRSVKNLVKTLITSMQLLHSLPKRRFGTFKLFYLDHVPDDYEPPHFTPGDSKKKYFFTTHAKNEVPEKISVGSLSTPYHGVELHVTSISEVISRNDDDSARFGNLVDHGSNSYSATQNMTLAERGKLIDIQQQDALLRKVVWDAEAFANCEGDGNVERERDPKCRDPLDDVPSQQPRGIRLTDGTVVEMNQVSLDEHMALQEFSGVTVDEPDTVKMMNANPTQEEIPPTQVIELTQRAPSESDARKDPTAPSTDAGLSIGEESTMLSRGIDTQLIQNLIEQRDMEVPHNFVDSIQDSEMLGEINHADTPPQTATDEMIDLETQVPFQNFSHPVEDPITSYPTQSHPPSDDTMDISQKSALSSQDNSRQNDSKSMAEVTECDCGVPENEYYGACQCEGPCGRWLHIWCMGYHSVDDPRLPAVFRCFACRLRNDPQIELLDSRSLTSEYISRFKDLSFFRRALKIIEVYRPDNVTRFKQLLGSETSMAGQAWKRLEAEGFITMHATETDEIGLLETQATTSRKSKGKGKQRVRKNLKRAKYIPVLEVLKSKTFQDYFEPAREASLLRMTKPRRADTRPQEHDQETTLKAPTNVPESQTQLSTQAEGENQSQSQTQLSIEADSKSQNQPQKRLSKRQGADERPPKSAKRIKISVGLGISLED